MPNIDITQLVSSAKVDKKVVIPAIVGWNRLEPRPRTAEFDRSLKAEIRDPLWMLTRQWQMGEFKGDDAGSPVNAQLLTEETMLNRYAVKEGDAVLHDDSIPLEARVERESIPDSLQLKIQVSAQFFRILSKETFISDPSSLIRTRYEVKLPADTEHKARILCNSQSMQLYEQARLRSIDGYQLLADIGNNNYSTWLSDAATGIAPADRAVLEKAGKALAAWFTRLYSQPLPSEEQAWAYSYLEYQFKCSAPAGSSMQTIISAEQYASGHLDWYSFDIDKQDKKLEDKQGETITDPPVAEKLLSFIPSPVSFPGMPNARYWEMEEGKTNFGAINANTNDLAQLLFAEFGLVTGNDWFVLPYNMKAGTICSIKGLIVTDTFGDRTLVRAAGEGADDDWKSWHLYNMSVSGTGGNADNKLIVIPATAKVMESEPLEKVNLIRDEVANMVWAVESMITHASGIAANGFEAASELSAYFAKGYSPASTQLPGTVKYTLGTSVPENWIPFISLHTGSSNRQIQLQRAAMPRTVDGSNTVIKPRTSILQGIDPYYIHEEEVSRSGTIITKTYQRTRWNNGRVVLWLGRRVNNGRGEGSSGLTFDKIEAHTNS